MAKLLTVGHFVSVRCGAEKSARFSQVLAVIMYLHISGGEANNRSQIVQI